MRRSAQERAREDSADWADYVTSDLLGRFFAASRERLQEGRRAPAPAARTRPDGPSRLSHGMLDLTFTIINIERHILTDRSKQPYR